MKRTCILVVLIALLSTPVVFGESAFGTFFGQLSTAKTIGQGRGNFGGGLGLGDNTTSFFGTFKYGLSRYGDISFQLGVVDPDGGDQAFSFGTDFGYQIWSQDEPDVKRPFDMAVGGFFQLFSSDGADFMHLGAYVKGSHGVKMSNGSLLSPYGRLNIRSERVDWGPGSDSNLEFGLNMGVAWEVTHTTTLYGELQLDGNDGLFLGLDFNVM